MKKENKEVAQFIKVSNEKATKRITAGITQDLQLAEQQIKENTILEKAGKPIKHTNILTRFKMYKNAGISPHNPLARSLLIEYRKQAIIKFKKEIKKYKDIAKLVIIKNEEITHELYSDYDLMLVDKKSNIIITEDKKIINQWLNVINEKITINGQDLGEIFTQINTSYFYDNLPYCLLESAGLIEYTTK